jgi:hypothetical protein
MTDLERAVLTKFLDGDHPVLELLRRQLETCKAGTREFTGAGFFTNLIVDESLARPVECNLRLGDVGAHQVVGLQHGAGFVLYVDKGMLNMLEGYNYGEPWPEQISGFKLHYINRNGEGGMSEERDWQALAKILDSKKESPGS